MFFSLFCFHTGFAQYTIPEKPSLETSVYDYANLLSASEKNQLEQQLIRYSDSTSTQIVVAIINSTNGENINYLGANWGEKWGTWGDYIIPNMEIVIFSKTQNKYTLSIKSNNGKLVYENDGIFDRGFNYIDYNLRYDKNDLKKSDDNSYYLAKGSYKLLITVNNSSSGYFFAMGIVCRRLF